MLRLLPDATFCVARSEAAGYSPVVPAGQLLLHDDLPGIIAIRNWLNDTIQEDVLVQVDDDLRWVRGLVGKPRKIVDPDEILQIILNSAQVAEDLGIGVFCWNRTQNKIISDPIFQPVRLVMPISCAFGLRGSARSRKFDPGLPGRADFDFTLRTLLEDRILYADARYYFDHGRILSGLGGNVGLLSSAAYAQSTRRLQERWGRYLSFAKPGYKKGATTPSMSVRVSRQNPLVRANWQ